MGAIIKGNVNQTGAVVWITGLSGAGKTTFMGFLNESLLDLGIKPILLDGDSLRNILGYSTTKYSKQDRLELAFVYSKLCKYLSDQGFIILIATIALFHEVHQLNRRIFSHYIEVLIDSSIDQIKNRNTNSIYDNNLISSEVIGVDFQAEFPKNPDFVVSGELKDFAAKSKELAAIINQEKNNERS